MWMVLGIYGELLGNDLKGVPGETVGDNQDPAVWLLGVKEIDNPACTDKLGYPGAEVLVKVELQG